MKRKMILKSISAALLAGTIVTAAPLGVSAQVTNSAGTTAKTGCTTNTQNNTNSVAGWTCINGKWYCLNSSNKKSTGWIYKSGKWYFADSNGVRQTGVIKISGKIYYFNNSGVMQTGRVRINGVTYTFSSQGYATGTKLPAYTKEFDRNGNLINSGNNGGTVTPPSNDNNNNNNNNNSGDSGNTDKDENITPPENNGDSDNNQGTEEKPDDNTDTDSGKDEEVTPPENNGGTVTPPSNDNNSNNNNNNNNNSGNGSINVNGLPAVTSKYPVTIQNSAETKILQLMNEKRTAAGLKPLTMDNTLLDVARYKSNHMIQLNYFSHTNPDGTNWTNWLKKIGYSYNATAENIAYNSYNAEELFNQWWNSSGHRQNMMNASYTKVGIGVLYGNGKYMGTQTFSN